MKSGSLSLWKAVFVFAAFYAGVSLMALAASTPEERSAKAVAAGVFGLATLWAGLGLVRAFRRDHEVKAALDQLARRLGGRLSRDSSEAREMAALLARSPPAR